MFDCPYLDSLFRKEKVRKETQTLPFYLTHRLDLLLHIFFYSFRLIFYKKNYSFDFLYGPAQDHDPIVMIPQLVAQCAADLLFL